MSESLKRQTIYGKSQYVYTFYWACWSMNVAIVKEHRNTGSVSWKVVRNLPLGRKLWRVLAGSAARVGKKHVCAYEDGIWDTERIKWVRMSLAE